MSAVAETRPPHHHRQRPLRLGADGVGEGGREEAESGEERGHEDGPEPRHRAGLDRGGERDARLAALVEVGEEQDAVQDGLADEGDEAHGCRDGQRDVGELQREHPARQEERAAEREHDAPQRAPHLALDPARRLGEAQHERAVADLRLRDEPARAVLRLEPALPPRGREVAARGAGPRHPYPATAARLGQQQGEASGLDQPGLQPDHEGLPVGDGLQRGCPVAGEEEAARRPHRHRGEGGQREDERT